MPCKLAIPTMSLGHCTAGHSLPAKLDAAKKYGYQGVEIGYEDIVAVAVANQLTTTTHDNSPPQTTTTTTTTTPTTTTTISIGNNFTPSPPLHTTTMAAAAAKVKQLCAARGLAVVSLQPFPQYEGLIDRQEHEARFREFLDWLRLARILGARMVMIPASSLPDDRTTGDVDFIVRDFQRAADAAAAVSEWQGEAEAEGEIAGSATVIRLAWEPRCSATHIDRWEFGWDVVRRVDRANFGLCLDTFHLAANLFADPSSPGGRLPGGETAVELSMRRLVDRLRDREHRDKVFLVQMGDARMPDEPILAVEGADHDPEKRALTPWSRTCRLFYREASRGAYLPVREIARAIFDGVGFGSEEDDDDNEESWVSLELFSRRMDCADPRVPEDLARRGAVSWRKLAGDMGWWPTIGSGLPEE